VVDGGSKLSMSSSSTASNPLRAHGDPLVEHGLERVELAEVDPALSAQLGIRWPR
jgi:hypothetical protein